MLEISNLSVQVEGKPLLRDVSLTIRPGEIHAIMGPNGAGKSTLAKVIAGHPSYEVLSGSIRFNGRDILGLDPEERAHLGLFMSFQYPVEIPGVTTADFLRAALNANRKAKGLEEMIQKEFDVYFAEKMALLDMKSEFRERFVNEGFSGGEKKRNEILQMAVLQPQLAVLDETDSGLDIDAMKVVARGVNRLASPEKSLLLITHYQRLLEYIKPHFVHVMIDGAIVLSGGAELAHELESKGYDWLAKGDEDEADAH